MRPCAAKTLPILAILTLGALFLIAGCSYIKPAPPAPVNTGPPKPFNALRAEAVMEFKGAKNLSGSAHILVSSPSSFLIEILGPFNSPVTTISSNGADLSIFSDGALNIYRWDEENPVLPYSFAPEELAALLMGGAALDLAKPPPLTTYSITRDKGGNITGVIKIKDGSELFKVAMSEFRDAGNGVLPFNLTIDDGLKILRVKYKSLEVNPDISPDVFNIAPVNQAAP